MQDDPSLKFWKLGGWEVFLSFPLSFGLFSGANS